MRDEIKQMLDEYYSKGIGLGSQELYPSGDEIMAYAIDHAPLMISLEMARDFFDRGTTFRNSCARWGLLVEEDPFTRNFMVRRPLR